MLLWMVFIPGISDLFLVPFIVIAIEKPKIPLYNSWAAFPFSRI